MIKPMSTQTALNEYEQLMEEIVTSYQWGEGFVKAVLLAITMHKAPASRNEYIKTMGKHFSIPKEKIDKVVELLPS